MRKKVVYLIPLGGVVILFLYTKFIYIPISRNVKEKEQKLQSTIHHIRRAQQEIDKLETIKSEIQILEEQLKLLQEKMQKTKDIPYLIRTITKVAEKNALKITNLSLKHLKSESAYDVLPVDITFSANYHSLANFISDICQQERIFSVRDLTITKSSGKGITISGKITVLFYIFK